MSPEQVRHSIYLKKKCKCCYKRLILQLKYMISGQEFWSQILNNTAFYFLYRNLKYDKSSNQNYSIAVYIFAKVHVKTTLLFFNNRRL